MKKNEDSNSNELSSNIKLIFKDHHNEKENDLNNSTLQNPLLNENSSTKDKTEIQMSN